MFIFVVKLDILTFNGIDGIDCSSLHIFTLGSYYGVLV